MKFSDLPWWGRLLVYSVVFGVLTALLEPYKPPNTPLRNGLISGVVFFLLFGSFMFWSNRRKKKKAATAQKSNQAVA